MRKTLIQTLLAAFCAILAHTSLEGGGVMLIAARNSFMVGGWKNPYVTDGLVAMWDGEWNAGGGVHDPNATVWKDLVGTNDFSNFKTGVVVNNNYIQIPAVQDAAVASSAYQISQVSTIEGVQSLSDWGGLVLASFGSDLGIKSRWLGFRANGTFNFGHGLECAYWGATANTPFSVSGTVQNSSIWNLYKNGAICQSAGAGMNWGQDGPYTASINKISVSYSQSRIYCIRLYDRALTADEIAANYAVDKARFGLP